MKAELDSHFNELIKQQRIYNKPIVGTIHITYTNKLTI